MILADIKQGDRVELAPTTCAYRDGDRTGRIKGFTNARDPLNTVAVVIGDQSGNRLYILPKHIARVLP